MTSFNINMWSYQYNKSHYGDKAAIKRMFILNQFPGSVWRWRTFLDLWSLRSNIPTLGTLRTRYFGHRVASLVLVTYLANHEHGLYSPTRYRIIEIGIPGINLRRSLYRLRLIMGISIPIWPRLFNEYTPWCIQWYVYTLYTGVCTLQVSD